MAAEGEKHEKLRDFFRESFKPPELDEFLKLKGFGEVTEAVNPNVAGDQYFLHVIEALDRRGQIDAEFFDRLAKVRPKKESQIKSLKQLWLDEEKKGSKPSPEELVQQVKATTTLVDLVWCIGKAVVQAGYEKDQADRACAQYLERFEQYAQVKILGMAEPVPLASIYTEVRIVPPTSLDFFGNSIRTRSIFRR
jgi:hypothetical protein